MLPAGVWFEEPADLPVWTATHQLEGCHHDRGAARLLAAVGRDDDLNPMANPKTVPLPMYHHTALDCTGNKCLPCLYHVLLVVISWV